LVWSLIDSTDGICVPIGAGRVSVIGSMPSSAGPAQCLADGVTRTVHDRHRRPKKDVRRAAVHSGMWPRRRHPFSGPDGPGHRLQPGRGVCLAQQRKLLALLVCGMGLDIVTKLDEQVVEALTVCTIKPTPARSSSLRLSTYALGTHSARQTDPRSHATVLTRPRQDWGVGKESASGRHHVPSTTQEF
jgi:hypothetical protein